MAYEVERRDIQGLIRRPFGGLGAALFSLLRFDDPRASGAWLERLERVVDSGEDTAERKRALQIAFTASGLHALGLDEETLAGFARPFRGEGTGTEALEGMVEKNRRRALGDVAENDPETAWQWGYPAQSVHGVLVVFTEDAECARRWTEDLAASAGDAVAFRPLPESRVWRAHGRSREHFGFADGIGNPLLLGLHNYRILQDTAPHNAIAAGEIVLGYPNESGRLPPSPHLSAGAGGGGDLPFGDLGRNGSYLVFRQLEQDVGGFWKFLLDAARTPDGAIELAAKMIGRWPNGSPLTKWPRSEPREENPSRKDDDFLYAGDARGLGCPLGAHIRRANPRDTIPGLDPVRSLALSRRRRILRRGRIYGDPVPGWPDVEKLAASAGKGGERGLYFLALNADLENQYEFIQQTWLNSRRFAGFLGDADPLLSTPDPGGTSARTDFTLQEELGNRRVRDLPQFVRARGGAYFFLPGKRALRYLARVAAANGPAAG